MVRLLFLLPLLMFATWFWFLHVQGLSIKQGWKGFIYIAIFNATIGVVLLGIMWLTKL